MLTTKLKMDDILSLVVEFTNEENYLFFSVNKAWMNAWGNRPKTTRALTNETTENQFIYSIENGLGRSQFIIDTCVRMNRLDLLKICLLYFNYGTFDNVCYCASCEGNFRILKWGKKMNFNWGVYTCDTLFLRGRYTILKWAIQNGQNWNGSCHGFWNYLNGIRSPNDEYESMKWLIGNKYVYDSYR